MLKYTIIIKLEEEEHTGYEVITHKEQEVITFSAKSFNFFIKKVDSRIYNSKKWEHVSLKDFFSTIEENNVDNLKMELSNKIIKNLIDVNSRCQIISLTIQGEFIDEDVQEKYEWIEMNTVF